MGREDRATKRGQVKSPFVSWRRLHQLFFIGSWNYIFLSFYRKGHSSRLWDPRGSLVASDQVSRVPLLLSYSYSYSPGSFETVAYGTPLISIGLNSFLLPYKAIQCYWMKTGVHAWLLSYIPTILSRVLSMVWVYTDETTCYYKSVRYHFRTV